MKMIKNSLKLSFILGVFLLSIQTKAQVQSEKARSPEVVANELTRYEVKELDLDVEQAKDLGKINLFYAQRLMKLRKQVGTENTKEEVEALKRMHTNKIRSLIGSEKYQEYLALKEKEKEADAKKDTEKNGDDG